MTQSKVGELMDFYMDVVTDPRGTCLCALYLGFLYRAAFWEKAENTSGEEKENCPAPGKDYMWSSTRAEPVKMRVETDNK